MKAVHKFLTRIEPPNWVMAIIALSILLRIPTLFEPYHYGDEMIYLTLGHAIRNHLTLYSQIHDNKPPLIYLVAGIAGNLFWFKAILMFWMIGTIIIFWHLADHLFKENKLGQKVSVLAFTILTTIPLLEGNIVNAELLLIGPIILAILLLLKNPTPKNTILAGLSFATAILFKVPAIFDVPVATIFWLITAKKTKDLLNITKKTLILSVSVTIPILLTVAWYYLKGAGKDYINAAFLQNIGYLSSWNTPKSGSFVVRNAPAIIKLGILIIGLIILRIKSSKLSKPFLVSVIWLLTSLFAATLSGRPYPHYLIQTIPAVSLLIGILITAKSFEQVLTVIPLTLLSFALVYYHFWYYPTAPYYQNFLAYISGRTSRDAYFNRFNKNTTNNYEVSQKIQDLVMPNEKIFVWGEDAPIIYALSRRLPPIKYVANYHITDFSTTNKVLESLMKDPPKVIVVLPNSQNFKGLSSFLSAKYLKLENSNSEIWRLTPKGLK